MATLLETGVSFLGSQLRAAAGVTVRVVDGNNEVELVAVPGRADQPGEGPGLETIGVASKDWLIDPADLIFDSELRTPRRGWKIHHNDKKFEVVHRGNGECFRYSDASQQMMRVYSQEI